MMTLAYVFLGVSAVVFVVFLGVAITDTIREALAKNNSRARREARDALAVGGVIVWVILLMGAGAMVNLK